MMKIFTLSAYETSAEAFFSTLQKKQTDLVLDVRKKNTSQLCGFTKGKDLAYFVPVITGADYVHDLLFAPSDGLLEDYLKHRIDWLTYKEKYQKEMQAKDAAACFHEKYKKYRSVCLLGTAVRKRKSHSEALLELLQEK